MSEVKVVVDTAVSMPPELVEKYGFGVARYTVQFGDESFLDDGTALTEDEFETKRTESGLVPKTAIPSTGQLIEIYRSISKPGDTIFSVHVGGKISGVVSATQVAAQEVTDRDVVVIDSDIVCMTAGFMAIEAAEAGAAGKSKEEIVALMDELRDQIDFFSISVELEYIKESGRIIGGDTAADSAVKNVPIIHFQDGKPGVTEQARTQNGALKRIIELVKERAGGKPIKRLAVIHANREPVALKYRDMVEKELAPQEIIFGQLGITLMTHLGPGGLTTCVQYSE